MGKGILLELEGRKAVVLTPDGEFKRVPAPSGNREIGAEIEFAESRPFAWTGLNLVAAAAVLLLLLVPSGYFGYNAYALTQPYALVSVDINPSLELTLNKQGDVLKAQGLNEDGKSVLQGIDLSHRRPLTDVMADVTQQAIKAGKLNPTDDASAVVVAVAPSGTKDLPAGTADQFATAARSAVQRRVTEQAKAQGHEARTHVAALEATAQENQEAAAKGLTPGQLLLLMEIQSQYPSVKPEDLKAMGPGKLIHSLGANPSDLFSQAEEHHGSTEQSKEKESGKGDEQSKDKGKSQSKENGKSQEKSKEQGRTQEPGNGNGNGKSQGQGQEKGQQGQGKGQGQQGQGQDQSRVGPPSRGQDRSQEPKGEQGQGKGPAKEKERGKSQSESGEAGDTQVGSSEQSNGLGARAETPGAGSSHGKKGQTP